MSGHEKLRVALLVAASPKATTSPQVRSPIGDTIDRIWPLILEALKAKDDGVERRIRSAASWNVELKAELQQAEHLLAEALKHLEALERLIKRYEEMAGVIGCCEGDYVLLPPHGGEEFEHKPDCDSFAASSFLKAQKDKQDVEGSPKDVLSRECEFDHHGLCTYEWTNPPIGVYTGRCRCTCPCHSEQPSTPQPTKGGGHSA